MDDDSQTKSMSQCDAFKATQPVEAIATLNDRLIPQA
jgi:hypothetical protein